jgi:hypothetical protein
MIVMAVFRVFVTVVNWLLDRIPTASSFGLPEFSSYITAIGDSRVWTYMGWANHFVPLDLALVLITARLAVWGAMYAFEFGVWCLTKAHILGGSS